MRAVASGRFFWHPMHRMVPYLFRLYVATRSVTAVPQAQRGAVDLGGGTRLEGRLAWVGPAEETCFPVDGVDADVAGGCPVTGWLRWDRASVACAWGFGSAGGDVLVVPTFSATAASLWLTGVGFDG